MFFRNATVFVLVSFLLLAPLCCSAAFADSEVSQRITLDEEAPERNSVADTTDRQLRQAYKDGDFEKAIVILYDKLESAKKNYGEKSEAVGGLLNELALNFKILGRYPEAERLYLRSLDILQKASKDLEKVAVVTHNLARLFMVQRRHSEAEIRLKESIALFEKDGNSKAENRGMALGNLGDFYRTQGRYMEAEPLLEAALKIVRQVNEKSQIVARTLLRQADLYRAQGRYEVAESLYTESKEILEKALSPRHPVVGGTLEGLALVYQGQERYDEAEQAYRAAISILEQAYGADHPSSIRALNNFALFYQLTNRLEEASALERRLADAPDPGARHVSLYFATNRRQLNGNVGFGGERDDVLHVGRGRVQIPAAEVINLARRREGGLGRLDQGRSKLTSADRLEIRTVEPLSGVSGLIEVGGEKLRGARLFKNRILIFVHGYNVNFEDALKRGAQIAFDLDFDGLVIPFSWPSRSRLLGYSYDKDSADIAVNHLVGLIRSLSESLPEADIDIIAHSMGNIVALEALEQAAVAQIGGGAKVRVREVVLAHPDVDSDRFAQLVKSAKPVETGLTLYSNSDDWALWFSRLMRGQSRAGGENLVIDGVDTIDTSDLAEPWSIQTLWPGNWGLNHDVFVRSPVLFGEISRLLLSRRRPPHERSRELSPVKTDVGRYWRFEQAGAMPR
jgi:esterase/lipase superfamily enzyme/tetratricopeptide (TPR) repeat protein